MAYRKKPSAPTAVPIKQDLHGGGVPGDAPPPGLKAPGAAARRAPASATARRPPRTWFGRKLQDLRISRKLAVVIVVHMLHATVLLGLTAYGVKAVDASRAWVDGEGFWSKAQKEAVVQLLAYADSGNESEYQSALAKFNITLGDRQARLELEKAHPDLAVARAGFIQANNHPADVSNMIWLFQTFRHEAHINAAIAIWTRAEDHGIEPLRALAVQLHAQRNVLPLDWAAINATQASILQVNAFVEGLEQQFSRTLGDGARFITTVVLVGTVLLTVVFVGSALLVSAVVARQISRSLRNVKQGAQRMEAGEYGVRLEVEGRDDVAQVAKAFNRMSEALASTMEQREEQASALAATLESTTDGVLVVDTGGRIAQSNQNFRKLWGIPDDVMESRDDARALAFVVGQVRDPDTFRAKVEALYADPEAESFDVLEFNDGRVIERYSKPQRIHGRTVGRVWSFRDVSQRRQAETQQHRALLQAEENRRLLEVDALKSDFINSAAHELRTPMTPIRAEMHILRSHKDRMDDPTRASIERLDRSLIRLANLVEDVLEGSRLQSGQLAMRKTRFELGKMARECVDTFQAAAAEKGLTLEAEGPQILVDGDEQRLSQVIQNFLSNAVKFTPAGGRVRVRWEEGPKAVTVLVEDSGIGIAPDKAAQLFRPFSQLHEQAGLRKTGTGLGLYISKGIVELHGGTIGCRSDGQGKGSTFYFTIARP